MKKLYRKGTVHPSPSPSPSSSSSSSSTFSDEFSLSYLPAAILTLAAALSAADKEVLSYLLAADKEQPHHHHRNKKHHHSLSPCFTCYCFNCYTSYWARWDSSPNRQLIHEIIDAFEDHLLSKTKTKTNNNKNNKKQGLTRREKRKNNTNHNTKNPNLDSNLNMIDDGNDYIGSGRVNPELGQPESEREPGGRHGNGGGDDETGEKQGSVRKLVGFIGERIWGTVWG